MRKSRRSAHKKTHGIEVEVLIRGPNAHASAANGGGGNVGGHEGRAFDLDAANELANAKSRWL